MLSSTTLPTVSDITSVIQRDVSNFKSISKILENKLANSDISITIHVPPNLLRITACARGTAEAAGHVQNQRACNLQAVTGSNAANCDEVAMQIYVSRHVFLRKVVLVSRSWEQHLSSIAATTRAAMLALIV
jgi:hypothetical protein